MILPPPVQVAMFLLPWKVRRAIFQKVFKYQIDGTAKIGFSIITAKSVVMEAKSKIGNLNMIKGLQELTLGASASIGNLNWITGFTSTEKSGHFFDQPERVSSLKLGGNSAVTNRHLIDCTDKIEIGEFSTVGGWYSQILTHSIDVGESRQRSAPVSIGNYCFVGTAVTIVKGSALPDYCVLAAGAVLTRKCNDRYKVYAGVPAKAVADLAEDGKYFAREAGYVW